MFGFRHNGLVWALFSLWLPFVLFPSCKAKPGAAGHGDGSYIDTAYHASYYYVYDEGGDYCTIELNCKHYRHIFPGKDSLWTIGCTPAPIYRARTAEYYKADERFNRDEGENLFLAIKGYGYSYPFLLSNDTSFIASAFPYTLHTAEGYVRDDGAKRYTGYKLVDTMMENRDLESVYDIPTEVTIFVYRAKDSLNTDTLWLSPKGKNLFEQSYLNGDWFPDTPLLQKGITWFPPYVVRADSIDFSRFDPYGQISPKDLERGIKRLKPDW